MTEGSKVMVNDVLESPYRVFITNMVRVKALLEFDELISKFERGELKQEDVPVIGPFMKLIPQFPQLFEDIYGTEVGLAIKDLTSLVQTAKPMPEEREKKAQILKEKWLPIIEPMINKVVSDLSKIIMLKGHLLANQATVLLVSSFEAFIKDSIKESINYHEKARNIFRAEINSCGISEAIKYYGPNLDGYLGEIAVSKIKVLDANQFQNICNRFLNIDNIFESDERKEEYTYMLQVRHIIIHRGGRVDSQFKSITHNETPIGAFLKVDASLILPFVDEIIRLAEKFNQSCESSYPISRPVLPLERHASLPSTSPSSPAPPL